jgi:hypothetical protein
VTLLETLNNAIEVADGHPAEDDRKEVLIDAISLAVVSFIESDQTRPEAWRNEAIEVLVNMGTMAVIGSYDLLTAGD